MARDLDRTFSETLPALPNVILVIVLALLMVWGVAGLYLPPASGGNTDQSQGVLTSDSVAGQPAQDLSHSAE